MSTSRWLRRAPWLALLGASGCVQILGLHDRSEATDSDSGVNSVFTEGGATALVAGQCGQLLHPSQSCASCMDQSCCAEARACAGDPACAEASKCLAGCSDAACEAQCEEFHALPNTLIALRSCRVRQCAPACASTCGESASAIQSCQSCMQSTCCAPETTCASDSECAALNLCISNCFGAASCPSACQSQHPLGVTDYAALLACSNQCATSCAPGQSWSCLNTPIVWPKPNAIGNVTFSVTFVNFSDELPYVNATVKACDKLDLTCTTPLASSATDNNGLVTLTVPVGLAGFDGYLDVSGGSVSGSSAAVYPALWYPVPYVIADGWRGRTLLPDADEFLGLTMATGTTLDPTRGHVALNAVDCAYTPAAGVSFAVQADDSKTVAYYLVGGVPATSATSTDQSGIGVFVNVPTNGPARLTVATGQAGQGGGKSMGSLTLIVRPGTLTTPSSFPPIP